jgi:hypothetical protein
LESESLDVPTRWQADAAHDLANSAWASDLFGCLQTDSFPGVGSLNSTDYREVLTRKVNSVVHRLANEILSRWIARMAIYTRDLSVLTVEAPPADAHNADVIHELTTQLDQLLAELRRYLDSHTSANTA